MFTTGFGGNLQRNAFWDARMDGTPTDHPPGRSSCQPHPTTAPQVVPTHSSLHILSHVNHSCGNDTFPNDTRLGMLDVIFNTRSKAFNMIFPLTGIGCKNAYWILPFILHIEAYVTHANCSLLCTVPSSVRRKGSLQN